MKKVVFAIILIVAGMSAASAQVRPGMKYNELKSIYSTKGYIKADTDPYSPGWNAFASFVVPGLGQVIARETGRGIGFFGASTALTVFGYYEAVRLLDNVEKDASGNYIKDASGSIVFKDESAAKRQVILMFAASLSEIVVDIWACIDAAKVSKVKNLYNRDLNKYSLEPSLYPSFQAVQTGNGYALAPGLTFALSF